MRDQSTIEESEEKGTGKCAVNTCTQDKYDEGDDESSEFCLKHILNQG